ncbi:hypothetical protein RND81_13G083600 [Saponaria officinalis]|uniref:Uncharacterized protein n=1 Tax=Saponaria officinalis TaxID=3572 RepID=A0AAW1H3T3_SAPOF
MLHYLFFIHYQLITLQTSKKKVEEFGARSLNIRLKIRAKIASKSIFSIVVRMADMCRTCKLNAKREYWHRLPVTKNFIKIMLGNFERELRIPREFVANFRERLPGSFEESCPINKLYV